LIQVTAQTRILVAIEAVDFRCGIDGLARVCRERLQADPFQGAVFVFRNRARNAVKLVCFDGQGMWLCHKRISQGRLGWWPASKSEAAMGLLAHELQVLLCGGDPTATQALPAWRPLVLKP
jgi:transposase